MEIWRMAQGPGGLDRLLADTREDEEDDEMAAAVAYAGGDQLVRQSERALAPARMSAREVLLAILHETPGADREAIMTSDAWSRAPGWTRPPADTTVTRAANDLGDKIDRGPKSASWRLTATGAALGAQAAAQLASPVTVTQAGEARGTVPGQLRGM